MGKRIRIRNNISSDCKDTTKWLLAPSLDFEIQSMLPNRRQRFPRGLASLVIPSGLEESFILRITSSKKSFR
jgi:hypothetical protein